MQQQCSRTQRPAANPPAALTLISLLVNGRRSITTGLLQVPAPPGWPPGGGLLAGGLLAGGLPRGGGGELRGGGGGEARGGGGEARGGGGLGEGDGGGALASARQVLYRLACRATWERIRAGTRSGALPQLRNGGEKESQGEALHGGASSWEALL